MPEPRTKSETADQTWYRRYPRDEAAETTVLTCEEYGTLQRFRDYSLIHGGIENDLKLIQRIGESFHLSKYKLNKIWNVIENFFTVRDGRFFYESDESERSALFVISCKRSLAGKLGASARWSDRNKVPSEGQNLPMANAIPLLSGLPSENPGEPELETDTTGGNPPPPTPASEHGGGGGSPPVEVVKTITDQEFMAIAQRAVDLGMAVPTRKLAVRLRQKFAILPIEDVVKILVRWEGQEHVGLWDKKTSADFELEASRQASGDRKPTARASAKETHQAEMLDAARELDRRRQAAK